MSEESVKINGVVQVATFLIFGLIYLTILYIIATTTRGQFLESGVIINLANFTTRSLAEHQNAKVILIGGIVFFSIVTGMLINDFIRSFSLISLFLLLIMTAVDFVPLKIIIEGGIA